VCHFDTPRHCAILSHPSRTRALVDPTPSPGRAPPKPPLVAVYVQVTTPLIDPVCNPLAPNDLLLNIIHIVRRTCYAWATTSYEEGRDGPEGQGTRANMRSPRHLPISTLAK